MHQYGSDFQTMAAVGSAAAARRIGGLVQQLLPVGSVLDVGCARGTWLRVWRELGCSDVIGVDGPYIDKEALEIPRAQFVERDLNQPFSLGRRFDLVECLEVAEHLPAGRAASLVADLVSHGGAVLFSAATPGQGGENHINEQPVSYWQAMFEQHGYVAVDCIRPALQGLPDVPAWYRYNLILYVPAAAMAALPPAAQAQRVAPGTPIADISPLSYRLRKAVIRQLPPSVANWLAGLNARRYRRRAAPVLTGRDHAGSPERFGYSWAQFAELTPDQEEQFRRWTAPIDPATGWLGAKFLDVGCGAGRNSHWAMRYGAIGGLAIDLDERSLALARQNLAMFPSVEVRSLSIYDLPPEPVFDIAFSIGVIHHLQDPDAAVRRMVEAVKPGGRVLIWVYGYENMALYVFLLNPLRHLLFSRLPTPAIKWLAHLPAAVLWLGLRIVPVKLEYLRLIRTFTYAHLHHILLDQMLPRIAHYWKRAEVEALANGAGLSELELVHVNGMSWGCLGRKPAA